MAMAAARGVRHWLAVLALSLLFCPPLAAQDNPLVQRGVPAEASAENAVAARDRAHASARRIAWQRMTEALGTPGAPPGDAQLEAMVAALIIEEERTTPTRYLGRLTVQFAPGPVSAALGRPVGGGAPGPIGAGMALNVLRTASATVLAEARHGSLPAWLDLRRRLAGSGEVVSVEVIEISIDRARLRLGLRSGPAEAAAALAASGLDVESAGTVWQVGLAGGR